MSTVGGAKSLRGGMLLMTPLLGADGETYAIAQGSLVVGGLGVTGNDGSSVIVNVPTVGRIPRGAFVERMVETPFQSTDTVLLNLHQGDFSTAMRVADAVNEVFGPDVAAPHSMLQQSKCARSLTRQYKVSVLCKSARKYQCRSSTTRSQGHCQFAYWHHCHWR